MATTTDLKASIAQIIKTNGNNEITGQLLQNVLFSMIDNGTLTGTVYNLSKITNISYSTRAAARVAAVQQQQINFAYGDILMYQMEGGTFVREMALTNAVGASNKTWLDISLMSGNRGFTFRGNSIVAPVNANNNVVSIVVDGELYFTYDGTVFAYRDGATNTLTPTIDFSIAETSIRFLVATLDRETSSFAIESIVLQNIKNLMDGKERVIIGGILKNFSPNGTTLQGDEKYMFDIPGLNELVREKPPRILSKTLDFSDIVGQGLINPFAYNGALPEWQIVNDGGTDWIEATFIPGVNQSIEVGEHFKGFGEISVVLQQPTTVSLCLGVFSSNYNNSISRELKPGETSLNAPFYLFETNVMSVGLLGSTHTEPITIRFRINVTLYGYDAPAKDVAIEQQINIAPATKFVTGGSGVSILNKGGGAIEISQTDALTGFVEQTQYPTNGKPYYLATKMRIKNAVISPTNFVAGGAGLTYEFADGKLTMHQTATGTGFVGQTDAEIQPGAKFIVSFDARILSGTEQLMYAGWVNSSATTAKQLVKLTPTKQTFELVLVSDSDTTLTPGFYIDGSSKQIGVDIEITNFNVAASNQNVRLGIISSGALTDNRDVEIFGDWQTFVFKFTGSNNGNSYYPGITLLDNQKVIGNVIEVEYLKILTSGSVGFEIYELANGGGEPVKLNYDYPVTSRIDAFLNSVSRDDKPLVRIACAGDSLIANEIGGAIPAQYDEGDTMRPMRLLSNGVPRRIYDFLSWNRPTWRRLDNADWTLSGFTQFTEAGLFEGTQEKYWYAAAAGSYVEITVPDGMENFAIMVRTKAGRGKLNVTLNGGAIGTYLNPYWTKKVESNTVVNSSIVPQYVPRGLSQIDTNFGVSGTGNPYAIYEFHNLPAGNNVLRFTTADATRVDIWGGFYWSGNTCVVMNIAHGGHTTTDLINQHLTDELYNAGYDAVLFEVTEMNNTRLTLDQTETDLRAIIERLRSIDIDFCFTSCNPLGLSIVYDTNFYANWLNPSQFEINERTRQVMNELNVPFVDLFQYFRWHIENRGGSLMGGEGGLWYTWDGQHGNPEGVKIWFECLKKMMINKPINLE